MAGEIIIREATEQDLHSCIELENLLNVNRADAPEQGFLRGGESVETYRQFLTNDIFYVAHLQEQLAGFLVILRTGSPRFEKLRGMREAFEISRTDLFELPNLLWGAKIAIRPELMRQGVASELCRRFIQDHGDANIVTTTAAIPKLNIPSRDFHIALGFERIGAFHVGDGVTIHDVMFREAR